MVPILQTPNQNPELSSPGPVLPRRAASHDRAIVPGRLYITSAHRAKPDTEMQRTEKEARVIGSMLK